MPHVLLHIGTHKTGSTSIQRLLVRNRRVLETQGVHYARAGRRRRADGRLAESHYQLGHGLTHGNEAPWHALRAEIEGSRARLVVISAENLSNMGPRGLVGRAAGHLEGIDVSVVVYLRDQRAYATSGYREVVSTGSYDGSFHDYNRDRMWRYDYAAKVGAWVDAFGVDAVHVYAYEEVCAQSGLLEHFVSHLDGVGIDELVLPPRQNATPSDDALQLARAVTRIERRVQRRFPWMTRVPGRLPALVVRRLICRDGSAARALGHRVAGRAGPIVTDEDLEWLGSTDEVRTWNDEFRRRWPGVLPEVRFLDRPAG